AELVMEFAFETLGVHRLEARATVKNGRGNGALLKIGAVQEGLLRRSFLKNGEFVDQVLYAIVEDDWRDIRNDMDQDLASANVHYSERSHGSSDCRAGRMCRPFY